MHSVELKYRYFEYLVERLVSTAIGRELAGVRVGDYLGCEGDFSMLKMLKLLFLVVGISSERNGVLLDRFNYFSHALRSRGGRGVRGDGS